MAENGRQPHVHVGSLHIAPYVPLHVCFSCLASQGQCFSVWALWKVKEMNFNLQLSIQLGKTLRLLAPSKRKGPSAEEDGVVFLWSNQNLSILSKGWRGELGRDYPPFLPVSGRQGCIEQVTLPTSPSPSQLPSTLPCSGSGGQEQRQHTAKKGKAENTAGN